MYDSETVAAAMGAVMVGRAQRALDELALVAGRTPVIYGHGELGHLGDAVRSLREDVEAKQERVREDLNRLGMSYLMREWGVSVPQSEVPA